MIIKIQGARIQICEKIFRFLAASVLWIMR